MRDLFFIVFLGIMFLMALKRPFLFVLVYVYIDIVSPQRLSYYLINSIPISAIAFLLVMLSWLVADNKQGSRFSFQQFVMLTFLGWCFYTTMHADYPIEAAFKWDWAWKAMIFAIFLPLMLRTRLRIEATALMMILCASAIIVTGGIKTIISGGGYGELALLGSDNSGMYEGSTASMVAIVIIPLILWLARYGTIFPPDRRVKIYAVALCGACLLIPIGTSTRTGFLCILLLGALSIWYSKRRVLLTGVMVGLALLAVPFLPSSFTNRMGTLKNYQGDQSASTRVEVWKWTWDYVKTHPMGGGFDAYRSNEFTYNTVTVVGEGASQRLVHGKITEKSRAYHSAYFEVLGEQGYPGFALWAMIHLLSLITMYSKFRRYRHETTPEKAWISPLALALFQGHLILLLGAAFIGVAYQPFVWMLLALEAGFASYVGRLRKEEKSAPMLQPQGGHIHA